MRLTPKLGEELVAALIFAVFMFVIYAMIPAAQANDQFPGATKMVPRAALKYRGDLIRSARLAFGLDAPVAAMAAQVHQESAWRPDARSPYAHGLAQFTPATAEWIGGMDAALAGADTGNPVWALRALAVYDRWLYDRVKGTTDCDRWWGALRAYNGGLGHWLKEARLAAPSLDRGAIDAQCGRASRSHVHCAESLGYPQRILIKHQPFYAHWGPGVSCL
jgi:soluble lytic murein transglycosylase-like protein